MATPLPPGSQHPSSLIMDGSSPSNNNNNQQNYLNTSSSSSGSSSSPAMGHDVGINQGHLQMGQRTLFPPPPNHHHPPHHHLNGSHIPREYNPNGGPMTSTSPYGMPNHPQNYPGQSGKPYRPWGAELAY